MSYDEHGMLYDYDPAEHPEYKTGTILPIVRLSRWQRFLKRMGWRKSTWDVG